MDRRKFLGVSLGFICAPAVVRASSLMPVRAWVWPEPPDLMLCSTSFTEMMNATLKNRAARLADSITRNNALLERLKERSLVFNAEANLRRPLYEQ